MSSRAERETSPTTVGTRWFSRMPSKLSEVLHCVQDDMKKTRAKEVYTFADLQNWRDTSRGIAAPIRLGVVGDPVAHSCSPEMQNAALKHSGLDMQYARFQIAPGE